MCSSLRTADVSPRSSPLRDVLRVEFLLAHRLIASSLIAIEGRFASWVPFRETSLSGDERGETSAVRRLECVAVLGQFCAEVIS